MFMKKQIAGRNILLVAVCLLIGLAFAVNAASADTEKAKERFNTGLKLMQEGKDTLAMAEYNMAIKEDPEFVDAYINLGSIYFNRNNYSEAESNFKKATEIDSKNPDAFANLGRTYYKEKKYLEAEEAYKAALSAKTGYYETYKDLGLLYHKQKNWPALAENMMRYTEKVQDDYLSYYLLGLALKIRTQLRPSINQLSLNPTILIPTVLWGRYIKMRTSKTRLIRHIKRLSKLNQAVFERTTTWQYLTKLYIRTIAIRLIRL